MSLKNRIPAFIFASILFLLLSPGRTLAQDPSIAGISPGSGGVGSSIYIAGSNFGATQGSSTVTFNGVPATATSWSNTALNATVPAGATTGNIVVTVGGVASNGFAFTVTTTPGIAGISPGSGGVGSSIYIAGSNFGATQGSSTVTFNGVPATATSWSNTALNATVPAGATTGNIVVTVGGVASNGFAFTVTTTPGIAGISPGSGGAGSSIYIAGSNFGATQGSSTVTFNGVPATATSWSNTALNATVPAGATTGNIVVTVGGVTSNGFAFTVTTTPGIAGISPGSGGVGSSIYIAGSNFGATQGSSTVTFNGVPATATSWSNAALSATVPAGATTGNIVVTVGGVASNGFAFTVTTTPGIAGISPGSGGVGSSIYIAGSNFGATQGSSTVTFNGVPATATSWSNAALNATVPAGATTGNIVVTVGGVASNGFAFTVTTTPGIAGISPGSGGVGSSIYIAGSNFGATQGSSTVTFNGVPATATSWSNAALSATVPAGATTGNIVVTVGGVASNGFAFTVTTTPGIAGISPGSGGVGSSIYIAGSNFGATQGSSTVTFNGVPATATSWSNAALSATVPAGATTGNIVVTVGGVASNGFNFVVGNPPSITLSAYPAPNASGWNNSNVTVTATCQAGSSPVTSCPVSQTISTEGANQVVSLTATDTNGLTATASVTLNIEKTPASLTGTSPADQSVLSTGTGSITGEVIPSLTAVTGVTCNGVAASFSSGGFSCNFSLNPGVNLEMVIATDVAGNTAGARLHLIYAAVLPAPSSLQITPATANVLVGATQQFTAVDQLGNPRTDASWTVDNTNIATISTDASPTLTGVAAGTVTLTASVGNASAQIQVNVLGGTSLTFGTPLWSAPPSPGLTLRQILQAAPTSADTPNLLAIYQDNNSNFLMSGFTGDGQMLWQSSAFPSQGDSTYQFLADGSGGLLVFSDTADSVAVADFDGQTGAQAWQANVIFIGNTNPAVDQDGGIYMWTLDGVTNQTTNLVKLDPQSGQSAVLASVPDLNVISSCNGFTFVIETGFAVALSPVVDAQGNTFATYFTLDGSSVLNCQGVQVGSGSMIGVLLKIAPDGTTSTYNVFSNPVTSATSDNFAGIIPDGQGGAFVVWNQSPAGSNFITDSTTGSTYPSPLSGGFFPLVVLGENSTFVESDGITVAALNSISGQVQWTYQPAAGVATLVATHGGGVTVFDGAQNQISIDALGNASTPISLGSPQSLQISLLGQVDDISSSGILQMVAAPLFDFADGSWDLQGGGGQFQSGGPVQGGGPVQNGHAQPLPYLAPLPSCPAAQTPCAGDALENALGALETLLSGACNACQTYVFSISQLGLSQTSFYKYLKQGHKYHDATRSSAKAGEVVCTPPTLFHPFPPTCGLSAIQFNTPLNVLWQQDGFAAISKTPSPDGAVIAFDPAQVCGSASATASVCKPFKTSQALNYEEGVLFHENLHGSTSLYDPSLEDAFGICSGPSVAITEYLNFQIFGLGTAPTIPPNQTCTQWP